MKFKKQSFVFFENADPAGIMFFNNSFKLAHQALEEFIQHIGIGWENWFNNPKIAIPLRHCQADFLKPILCGKNINIEVSVKKLSSSSVSFIFEFKVDNEVHCIVEIINTFIQKSDQQKTKIPIEIKDKLSRYLS